MKVFRNVAIEQWSKGIPDGGALLSAHLDPLFCEQDK